MYKLDITVEELNLLKATFTDRYERLKTQRLPLIEADLRHAQRSGEKINEKAFTRMKESCEKDIFDCLMFMGKLQNVIPPADDIKTVD